MKVQDARLKQSAFTILELLLVLVLVAILVALCPCALSKNKVKALRIDCMNNQKQVAISLLQFAGDHGDTFPWHASQTNEGVMELSATGDVLPTYLALSNYAGNTRIFHCRTDQQRSAAVPGASLARTNISYLLGLDGSPTHSPMNNILTGDRHIAHDGVPVPSGIFQPTTNSSLTWTAELHPNKKKAAGGIMTFIDGHTEWVAQAKLNEIVARQSVPTNRLAIP